ncbi:MAG: AlpA family phage regulatory protein [Gammaproteobacteria bacterium]|nr:AlpA family phage regulatory protein [Gammaproteobacteria bacterium]
MSLRLHLATYFLPDSNEKVIQRANEGTFSASTKIGEKSLAWRIEDIEQWIFVTRPGRWKSKHLRQ